MDVSAASTHNEHVVGPFILGDSEDIDLSTSQQFSPTKMEALLQAVDEAPRGVGFESDEDAAVGTAARGGRSGRGGRGAGRGAGRSGKSGRSGSQVEVIEEVIDVENATFEHEVEVQEGTSRSPFQLDDLRNALGSIRRDVRDTLRIARTDSDQLRKLIV